MSRVHESDGESNYGYMWTANLERVIRGKRGQKMLREFCYALLSLKERRLVPNAIITTQGEYCAVGALAVYKGVDMSAYQGDDYDDYEATHDTLELGRQVGLGHILAWELMYLNDEIYGARYAYQERRYTQLEVWDEWSDKHGKSHLISELVPTGHLQLRGKTPEERWQALYDWAAARVQWNLPAPLEAVA